MKHLIRIALVTVLSVGTIGLVGCEWSGGSSDNSWNDSSTIANFNGTYQASGGYLVSEYSASSAVSSTSSNSDILISESQGSFAGTLVKMFTGTLSQSPITPGSVTLSFSGPGGSAGSFHADSSGNLTGSYTAMSVSKVFTGSGFVDHSTGAWRIQLSGSGSFSETITISATYRHSVSGSSSGGTSSGASGVSIFAFNVQQTGNSLKIIDNNGSIYQGSLGNIRTTGNLGSTSTGATFVNGDQVSASFSASGTSAAGVHVNLTGTFQGTAAGVNQITTKSGSAVTYTTSMALSDRRIMGTWIEDGGKTGNINGVCPSAVNVSSSSTSTNIAF